MRIRIQFIVGILFNFFIISTFACTDFIIRAKDGSVVVSRTLEYALDLQSNLVSTPRDQSFHPTTIDGKPGLSWKTKYGYVFLDGLQTNLTVDGMNEKGLSFEYLYLPGETTYQTAPAAEENKSIPYLYLGDWVLGNFQTVDEVRAALKNIYVIQQNIPQAPNMIFPLHAIIDDASGKAIVVEFVNGKMNIYDSVGVTTNSPTYDWHVTNLRNYINLSPYSPSPITVNGVTFATTGQGSGMVGLPGDYSPPSRFVKAAVLLKTAYHPNNAGDALNLAQHIVNNFDIALGTVRARTNGKESDETTQWAVFKDLTNKIFYYRTYTDLTLHSVDLSKINFSANAGRLRMPVADKPFVLDVTQQFLQKKS